MKAQYKISSKEKEAGCAVKWQWYQAMDEIMKAAASETSESDK
jgi:hypothetical protein